MSGKRSRDKGNREELHLVSYLKSLGYEARRIPLSGAMQGYKHDVEALLLDGGKITFENKSRKGGFKTIYNLYRKYVLADFEKVIRFSISYDDIVGGTRVPKRALVAFGPHFEEVRKACSASFPEITKEHPDYITYRRIARMDKLRADADYLVLKDNHNYRLFFKYWVN